MPERFWQKVDKSGDCWLWTGYINPSGYGQFQETSTLSERAHRTSWKLANGPIPPGMFVCHHCDNPPCVNPAHLFIGTGNDNMADKVAKGRQARGESVGGCSDAVVAAVFRLASEGLGNRRIAKALGMSKNGVAGIRTKRRRAWQFVDVSSTAQGTDARGETHEHP